MGKSRLVLHDPGVGIGEDAADVALREGRDRGGRGCISGKVSGLPECVELGVKLRAIREEEAEIVGTGFRDGMDGYGVASDFLAEGGEFEKGC